MASFDLTYGFCTTSTTPTLRLFKFQFSQNGTAKIKANRYHVHKCVCVKERVCELHYYYYCTILHTLYRMSG